MKFDEELNICIVSKYLSFKLLITMVKEKEKNHFVVEKCGRHHLTQEIKANITHFGITGYVGSPDTIY